MSYRGPALQYKIRKTTSNNKTGDNFSITIPRVIANQFKEVYFKMSVSGNIITFESGCKISVSDLQSINSKTIFTAGGVISFK